MAELSFPFASIGGDRKIGAETYQRMFGTMFTPGIFPRETMLAVSAAGGMQISVAPGSAVLVRAGTLGYLYFNDAPLRLTVGVADGVADRIDQVVLRWSRLGRSVQIALIQGTPSSTPAAPSLIRTEADELTYALHIMVRYELEKRLLAGTLDVNDLPAEWNRLYREYLGVGVPDDARGVLQDVHWSTGDFGYFPGYALGTAYAAQMVQAMRAQFDFDACCRSGDLRPIQEYLAGHIWQYGKALTPDELIQKACGGPFDPGVFIRYLQEKYRAIYAL